MINRTMKLLASAAVAGGLSGPVQAGPTFLSGHISEVTFAGDQVLIRLNTGVPDNCAGTPFGWMIIPIEYKPMAAFVLGLWMRGDASQVSVTVYTDGLVLGNYCRINQIDPAD